MLDDESDGWIAARDRCVARKGQSIAVRARLRWLLRVGAETDSEEG